MTCGHASMKPLILNALQVNSLKSDLKRFKNNPYLFLQLLTKQPQMPLVSESLEMIVLGNSEAANTITIVTNPYCSPCASAHLEVMTLLEECPAIKCQIVFAGTNDRRDKRSHFARHIFSLPEAIRINALEKWYSMKDKNFKQWSKEFDTIDAEVGNATVELHYAWCDLAKIERTPTYYWNGYKLPEVYQIKDLKYFTHVIAHEELVDIQN